MKLYGVPASPFTQRVLLAARIKGHAIALEPPPGGLASEAFIAISPMQRIPVLEEADGWRLAESAAIVAYLDAVLPGPRLTPDDPRERAVAEQMVAIADGEIGAGLRHFALNCMFRICDEPAQLAYGRAQLLAGLRALDRIGIGSRGWAVSATPGIADVALAPVLAFADLMTAHFDGGPLIETAPRIAAYWQAAQLDPRVAETVETMASIVPILAARRAAAAQQA